MRYVKGIITGILVGTAIGAMNSDKVIGAIRKSQKGIRRFSRRFAR
jgi:hypothetical protein